MKRPISDFIAPIIVALATAIGSVPAQEAGRPAPAASFAVADDVSVRRETIWSEGSRMAANIYSPKGVAGKLPTIVMAYGWGGTMEQLAAHLSK